MTATGAGLLAGKVVLISGVGPGMGRSLALAHAQQGADVILAARKQNNLDAVRGEVEALGRRVVSAPTDVTDRGACAALVARGIEEFGRLDVLVNNAFRQPPMASLGDTSIDEWRKAFDVNLFGAVNMTEAALATMRVQGSGSVVFIASLSARRVREQFAVYSATKSALLTTMQHYANEVGRAGIRVNAVVPSYIWGPNLESWFALLAEQRGVTPQQVYDDVAKDMALRRIPTADEVAATAMLLSSDFNSAVTGAALDINAGEWFH
ncbi:MAG: NAD(P)-dependent dehydrogenase (short-subunit alcohol dehydrogenase family) [Glaciecola sp.]